MRLIFCVLAVAACSPPAVLPDAGSAATVELPFEPLDSHGIYLVGQLDAGVIRFESTVTYATGPGFPLNVRIDGTALPAFIGNCFSFPEGSVRWSSIDQGSGDGVAHLQLGLDGDLTVVVRDSGSTRYVLRGEFSQPDGGRCGGSIPFVHDLTLEVRPATGVNFSSSYDGCPLPAGVEVQPPYLRLVAPDGGLFQAANARRQAAVTIQGPIAPLDGGALRLEGPGDVTFTSGATTAKYTVVSAPQLSTFEAHWARHVYSKVNEWVPLDGGSPVNVSGGRKALALVYDEATVGADALCTAPPKSWYRSTSSTPSVCADDGSVLDDGRCRLDVTVPGSRWSWSLDVEVSSVH